MSRTWSRDNLFTYILRTEVSNARILPCILFCIRICYSFLKDIQSSAVITRWKLLRYCMRHLKNISKHIIRINLKRIIQQRQSKTEQDKTVNFFTFDIHSVGIKSPPRVAKWTCHVKTHWWLFKCINYISVMSRIYISQLLTWKWMRCEKVQYSATLDDKIVKKTEGKYKRSTVLLY